ncbi:MAG: hypothetical protein QOE14_580 [Humisphaera sp.]|nr:hypothetical protein [Humisphaera sp.]
MSAARASAAEPTFTVTDKPAGPPLVGFGVQMNPYLYCTPTWPRDVNDGNVKDFEEKVLALRPQHVRIFYRQEWFEGGEDNVSKGDPRMVESFVRQCRLAQRAGATINVSPWRGPWPEPEKQMAAFAATLDELIRAQKLTAIRYVTVQNEPNTTKLPMATYNRLYRSLDAELKNRGLRDEIKIISGDLVQNDQQDWFANLGKNLAGVSDGYSIHVYWDYWDTEKLVRRISEVPKIVAALPLAQQRPLYVTEFGVRGHREKPSIEPGDHDDGTPIAMKPLQAMELAWFQMEAMNRGYVATVIWTLEDAWYDRLMPYGVIGAAKDGFPLKPGYHMLRLFTHTIEPGWRTMKVDGSADGCIVAAARGPKGELTVLALNQTDTPRDVSIRMASRRDLDLISWNQNGDGQLAQRGVVTPQAGAYVFSLPALGLTALTTQEFPK